MSRGPGRIQREVLEVLREDAASSRHQGYHQHYTGLRYLVRNIAGRKLNPELLAADHSLIESVRRAVKALERRGLVETGYIWYDAHNPDETWLAEHEGSGLHLKLSAEEWAAVQCGVCTIGPCVGGVPRGLLRGCRSHEYACPVSNPSPLLTLQNALSVDVTVNT